MSAKKTRHPGITEGMSELGIGTMQPHAAPTQSRIEVIDILRGFALFGILVVNMGDFSSPGQYFSGLRLWTSSVDRWAEWVVKFFFDGRFYPLFSFLFGLGFGIQMLRLEERGVRFVKVYSRRLVILFFIGLLHGILLWWGDVLAVYAFYGFVLLFLRRLTQKSVIVLSIIVFLIPVGVSSVRLLTKAAQTSEQHLVDGRGVEVAQLNEQDYLRLSNLMELYSHGTYAQILDHRFGELVSNYEGWMYRNYGANVFGMFLFGLFVARKQVFRNLEEHRSNIRNLCIVSGLTTVIGLAIALYQQTGNTSIAERVDVVVFEFFKIERIFQCLLYCCAILLLVRSRILQKILAPLAAAGRMALTNYLLQSFLCGIIFYGYGFQQYGKLNPSKGLALSVAIVSLQVMLSNWWIRRFRFGPMEWAWKSLTYGSFQSMKIVRVA